MLDIAIMFLFNHASFKNGKEILYPFYVFIAFLLQDFFCCHIKMKGPMEHDLKLFRGASVTPKEKVNIEDVGPL